MSSKCIDIRKTINIMNRKFFKSGNGWALFIPKNILELLKIDPKKDLVEFQIENNVLKIKKITKS